MSFNTSQEKRLQTVGSREYPATKQSNLLFLKKIMKECKANMPSSSIKSNIINKIKKKGGVAALSGAGLYKKSPFFRK